MEVAEYSIGSNISSETDFDWWLSDVCRSEAKPQKN